MPASPDSDGTTQEPLYEGGADLYDLLFGEQDEEEIAFYLALLSDAPNKSLLSLGCGTGRLEASLSEAGFRITGIDESESMLERARERDPTGQYIATTMEAMPESLPGEPFGAIISGTLSFSYITDQALAQNVIHDCARRMMPGGILALDIPVAHEPRRLEGTTVTMETSALRYRFMWYDVIAENDCRAVLDSEIMITGTTRTAKRRAQLTVYLPQGIRHLLESGGLFKDILFHAPHDIATATPTPPLDCRRAVVTGRKFI